MTNSFKQTKKSIKLSKNTPISLKITKTIYKAIKLCCDDCFVRPPSVHCDGCGLGLFIAIMNEWFRTQNQISAIKHRVENKIYSKIKTERKKTKTVCPIGGEPLGLTDDLDWFGEQKIFNEIKRNEESEWQES